ncbi:MAG: TPM domain-containing protein [Nanoarchaeota archaeon]|nr:TPM domain-containing protein [Nanoarchaeota archaeon]MBU4124288.1 TPM domain-containing protein [Nanoarchaeota archaeon]
MKKILLVLMLVIISTSVFAVPIAQDKYVNDYANIFSSAQISELRAIFTGVDSTTTAEMTLLTVDTVAPLDMFSYAQEVAENWKIGKADKDNGLLILYAKQENKIWVSTGYGLEGILPDSKLGRILDEMYVPARDTNNTAEGIILVAREYANVINQNADDVRSGQATPAHNVDFIFMLFVIMIFFMFPLIGFIGNIIFTPKCKKCNCRMKLVSTKYITEKEKGTFGIDHNVHYTIRIYRCSKCDCEVVKKTKSQRGGFIPIFIGGSRGGGFSGGGFGGGGFGGGGAGR